MATLALFTPFYRETLALDPSNLLTEAEIHKHLVFELDVFQNVAARLIHHFTGKLRIRLVFAKSNSE